MHSKKNLENWIKQAEDNPRFCASGQLERWRAELDRLNGSLGGEGDIILPHILGGKDSIEVKPSPSTADLRLAERRINERTILTFDIQSNGNGWEYPTPGGGMRWKAYDSQNDPKYRWIPSKPENSDYYHADDLLDSVRENYGACWLASGEADVWSMYSAGVQHVFSCGFCEGKIPDDLANKLQSMGVLTLYIAPDLDNAGERWARKVATKIHNSGIELDCRVLPHSLGKSGDLGRAWQQYPRRDGFERYLLGLPRVEIKPEKNVLHNTPLIGASDIPLAYRREIADELGVGHFKSDGFSRKNVLCPFHQESRPSASLHQEKGLYCHHAGEWHTWTDTGAKLGIGSLRDWLVSHPDEGRFTVLGLSTETREAIPVNVGRLYDGLFYAGLTPGKAFTITEASQLCGISRKTISRTIGNYGHFFPPFLLQHIKLEKNVHNSGRGRKAEQYQLLTPQEVAQIAKVKGYQHYDSMPIEAIASVKLYRAEVYAALPRRKPGQYSRQFLAGRVGVSTRTAYNYDKLAGLYVKQQYEKRELEAEDIEQLPEKRDPDKRSMWLEDSKGNRYQRTKKGAEYASQRGGKIYEVRQLKNYYAAGLGDVERTNS